MATRDKHRDLAYELLLAYQRQQSQEDMARYESYVDAKVIEALFDRPDHVSPLPCPHSYLLLPQLTRGAWRPKLGFVLPYRDKSHKAKIRRRSALEFLTLEVILVPVVTGDGGKVAPDNAASHVAFRFEPPTCLAMGQADCAGDHDYYHMQFVSVPRTGCAQGSESSTQHEQKVPFLSLPDTFPAFPIRAKDFGSLVLALTLSLYGRKFVERKGRSVELDLTPNVQNDLRKAFEELDYWKWEPAQ